MPHYDKKYHAYLAAGDYAGAIEPLLEAIRQDDAYAMGAYGALLAMGRGVTLDMEEATLWFRQAANRGEIGSQTAFAVCLIRGSGVEKDLSEAAYWLTKAARAGHPEAVKTLADLALVNQAVVLEHISVEEVGRMELKRLKGCAMPLKQ